jgi:hypothetical protein
VESVRLQHASNFWHGRTKSRTHSWRACCSNFHPYTKIFHARLRGSAKAQLSLQTAKDISHCGNVLSFKHCEGGATKPSAQALQNGSRCSSRVWTRCVSIGKSDLWSREELSLHSPKNGGCSNRFSGSLTAHLSTFVLILATSSTVFTKMVTVMKTCSVHNNIARFAWHRAKLGP